MKEKSRTNKYKSIVLPVILSGGVGSRLWPLSREAHPKPFIKLSDGQSLLQKTYLRATAIGGIEEIVTVTNRALFFYTKDEYDAIPLKAAHHSFLLEPFGRNSAAAVAVAAYYAQAKYGDNCILLILPSDHLISNQAGFVDAVTKAASLASQGKLVTFGVQPDSPKTDFGYIEAIGTNVLRFIEKPDHKTAQKYLASGGFYWNSGMFCMGVRSILAEMRAFCPDIARHTLDSFNCATSSQGDDWSQIEISATHFKKVSACAIDYAVFERSKNIAVIQCDIGWSDIGSWNEFGALYPRDEEGNHISGEVVLEDVSNCIIHSESRLVAGLGLDNLLVADTADALLIAHKKHAQDVRKIVSSLKGNDNHRYKSFPTVHRPWGTYTVLLEGKDFKIKQIIVKPGAALSLQSHKHRSEHWVIVSGTAKITNDGQRIELKRNQSAYIPINKKHRLENQGEQILILIEVQCGDYLGEDDIIRYEDNYGQVMRPPTPTGSREQ